MSKTFLRVIIFFSCHVVIQSVCLNWGPLLTHLPTQLQTAGFCLCSVPPFALHRLNSPRLPFPCSHRFADAGVGATTSPALRALRWTCWKCREADVFDLLLLRCNSRTRQCSFIAFNWTNGGSSLLSPQDLTYIVTLDKKICTHVC